MDPRLERKVLDHICQIGKIDPNERRAMEQASWRKGVGPVEYLLNMGYITDGDVASSVADVTGLPYEKLAPLPEVPEALARLMPSSLARRFSVVPLSANSGEVAIAVAEPLPLATLSNLARVTRSRIRQVIAERGDLHRWIKALYQVDMTGASGGGGGRVT